MAINNMFVGWEGQEDEIFELAMAAGMGRPRYKALGAAFETILKAAYEADRNVARGNRYIEIPVAEDESINKSALVLLSTLLHYLVPAPHEPFQTIRYALTRSGRRFCEEVLLLRPLTFQHPALHK